MGSWLVLPRDEYMCVWIVVSGLRPFRELSCKVHGRVVNLDV